MDDKKLSFLVKEDSDYQSLGPTTFNSVKFVQEEISAQSLKEQFHDLADTLGSVFSDIETERSKFELDEIELKVDVSLKTGISILAKAELETSGGISLTFKRKEKKDK